jgi:hypothetical protein
MRKMWLPATVRWRRHAWPTSADPGQFSVAATRRLGTGRIRVVQETNPSQSSAPEERTFEVAMDESRVLMMRREKEMTVEQRIELFERLSRDAAWARSAKRVR